MQRPTALLAALLSLVLLAAACGGSSDDAATPSTDASGSETTAASASATTSPATTAVSTTSVSTTTVSTTTVPTDPCAGAPVATASSSGVLTSGGNDYSYDLYVPTSFDGSPLPLVLNFHGLGSSGTEQAAFSEYTAKAQQEGFVVVHPSGLVIDDADGRASWELPQLDTDVRDDVAMASDLIDHVASLVCIDLDRVYATGMSNGGFFSSVLACELSDRIAATFSVAAVTHPEGCEPARPIAMGALHGTADPVVSYDGQGSVLLDSDDPVLVEFFSQVMPDELAEFATDFGCATTEETTVGPDTTLLTYSDCDGGVELVFYTVDGGGHTWPGSLAASMLSDTFGYATPDVSATDAGWEFMSQYSLAG